MSLLDGLLLKNVILVGYSLGARLALYLAERHGHRLHTVVSISGSTGVKGAPTWSSGYYHAADMLLLTSCSQLAV